MSKLSALANLRAISARDFDDEEYAERREPKPTIDPRDAKAAAAALAPITLTEGQDRALNVIMDWIRSPSGAPAMVLTGHAGTGKTTLVQEVVRLAQLEGKRVCLTAPTNKATKVLKEMGERRGLLVDCKTAHSAHGLRLMDDDEEEYIAKSDRGGSAHAFDLLVADEASMIDDQLFNEFMTATWGGLVRVLFVGDRLQLPPVKGQEAPAFKLEAAVGLDKIVRQAEGNPIVLMGDWLRKLILGESVGAMPKTASPDELGVHLMAHAAWQERMTETIAARHLAGKAGTVRAIAFTNRCVDSMVDAVRARLYGPACAPFVEGERVFALKPYGSMKTDYEAAIVSVADAPEPHPRYTEWLTMPIALQVDGEDEPGGCPCAIDPLGLTRDAIPDCKMCKGTGSTTARAGFAIHPSQREAWEKHLDNDRRGILNRQREIKDAWFRSTDLERRIKGLTKDGRTDEIRRAWKGHHGFRRSFANLKSVHAITAHRSQGSTFDEVFVNVPDMRGAARVGGESYKYRLMYVAVTRAREHAWLLW